MGVSGEGDEDVPEPVEEVDSFLLPFGSFRREVSDIVKEIDRFIELSTPFWEFRGGCLEGVAEDGDV